MDLVTIKIPILIKKLGVMTPMPGMLEKISAALNNDNLRLPEMIGAILDVHKADIKDMRAIREKFGGMRVEAVQENGAISLICRDMPAEALYDGQNVIWASVEQITAVIRDVVFPPSCPGHGCDSKTASSYVRKFVEHAGFLYRGERGLVTFVWGGHRVPREEYDFAKELSYWLTLAMPDVEIITGCGAGIMKAPFKGASVAYAKQRSFDRFGQRDFIGFTEKNILAAEPPNELVNRFVVFPTIEQRMEAFIRGSHRGRAHPGGAGTLEEILTVLTVRSAPENRGMLYEFDMVERPGGKCFEAVNEYLETCFGDYLKPFYTLHRSKPREYARHVADTTKDMYLRYLWNDALHFPKELQKPFTVNFESMEGLYLGRDQEPFMLLINMRRFFSAIVHLTVKDPDLAGEWNGERPLIKGDKDILEATDNLIKAFAAQRRLHLNGDRIKPYRVA
jgi:hypothetical protein